MAHFMGITGNYCPVFLVTEESGAHKAKWTEIYYCTTCTVNRKHLSGWGRDVRVMRVHGLERPFHFLQVLTWLLFPTFLGVFYCVVLPLLWPSTAMAISCAVYTLAAATSCFAVCLASEIRV